MTNSLNLRIAVAMDSPREPLADLAARRREMLRSRNHRERGPTSDWQWKQIQARERNFYSIALAKVARPCRRPDMRAMFAHAEKCNARVETIRNAQ